MPRPMRGLRTPRPEGQPTVPATPTAWQELLRSRDHAAGLPASPEDAAHERSAVTLGETAVVASSSSAGSRVLEAAQRCAPPLDRRGDSSGRPSRCQRVTGGTRRSAAPVAHIHQDLRHDPNLRVRGTPTPWRSGVASAPCRSRQRFTGSAHGSSGAENLEARHPARGLSRDERRGSLGAVDEAQRRCQPMLDGRFPPTRRPRRRPAPTPFPPGTTASHAPPPPFRLPPKEIDPETVGPIFIRTVRIWSALDRSLEHTSTPLAASFCLR